MDLNAGVRDCLSQVLGANTFASGKYITIFPDLTENAKTRPSIWPVSFLIETFLLSDNPNLSKSSGLIKTTSRVLAPR